MQNKIKQTTKPPENSKYANKSELGCKYREFLINDNKDRQRIKTGSIDDE